MATQQELADRVNDNVLSLYPAERPLTEPLGTTYSSGTTSITVGDGANYATGDVIENWDTGEQFYVSSVAGNVLTVSSAYNGTANSAGALGERVRKNPKITRKQVDDALQSIIEDLRTHGVYNKDTTSFTLDQTVYIYPIDLGDLVKPPGVIAVYYPDPSTDVLQPIPFKLVQAAATAALSGGEGLQIVPGTWDASVTTAYITKAVAYASATTLPAYLEEPVVIGTTGRVLGKFIAPILVDPGHLSNRTVPPGQAARDARWYQGEYITAVRRIAAMLAAEDDGLSTVRLNRARRWRT